MVWRMCLASLALAACLGFATPATAATIAAANCSQSAVQAAISSASDGDTVTVPGGACIWADTVSIGKRLRLIGNNTVITSNVSNTLSMILMFTFPLEMSGFTIDGGYKSSCVQFGGGSTTPFVDTRIHDNTFRKCNTRAVQFSGLIYGVFYKNTLTDNGLDFSSYAGGSNGWNAPFAYGDANSIFVEDNTISHPSDLNQASAIDTGQGGRMVFRHNQLSGYISYDLLDAHGNQGPFPANRGTVGAEVYDNTFTLTPGTYAQWRLYAVRGGQVIAFNNTVTGGPSFTTVTEEDGYQTAFGCPCPLNDTITNSFFWNNKANGTDIGVSPADVMDLNNVKEGVAWFRPPFGPLSARPASGTYYAATDTERIYKYVNGAWTTYYTPYTYPHPLRGNSQPTAPQTPRNVRIVRQ